MQQVLLDTGPLVAFLQAREKHHVWAVEQFQSLPLPFLTCEAVLVEATYLLKGLGISHEGIFQLLTSGAVTIGFDIEAEAESVSTLLTRYANVPMDLADGCLVRMSELYPNSQVLTLDSDFLIYRKARNQLIPVVMP